METPQHSRSWLVLEIVECYMSATNLEKENHIEAQI